MRVHAVKKAMTWVWLIVSATLFLAMALPYLVPEEAVLVLSGAFQSAHDHVGACALCGLTRGFVAISQGDWMAALSLNKSSVALYGAILINQFGVLGFLTQRIYRFLLSRRMAGCGENNPLTQKEFNLCR